MKLILTLCVIAILLFVFSIAHENNGEEFRVKRNEEVESKQSKEQRGLVRRHYYNISPGRDIHANRGKSKEKEERPSESCNVYADYYDDGCELCRNELKEREAENEKRKKNNNEENRGQQQDEDCDDAVGCVDSYASNANGNEYSSQPFHHTHHTADGKHSEKAKPLDVWDRLPQQRQKEIVGLMGSRVAAWAEECSNALVQSENIFLRKFRLLLKNIVLVVAGRLVVHRVPQLYEDLRRKVDEEVAINPNISMQALMQKVKKKNPPYFWRKLCKRLQSEILINTQGLKLWRAVNNTEQARQNSAIVQAYKTFGLQMEGFSADILKTV